jgi:hypothetical protein
MAMGCYGANSQANSWSLYFKTQEYDNCRGISQFINKNIYGEHSVFTAMVVEHGILEHVSR